MTLSPIEEFDTPYPRRYRWLLRLTAVYVVLIGTLVGGWFAWDAASTRRLDAEIARLRAKGQMVLASDFADRPKIPDGQNAALLYQQAWAINFNQDQNNFDKDIDWDVRLTPKFEATLLTFPVDFAANLQLARQARSFDKADFGVKFSSPSFTILLPYLNPMRELANLTSYSAEAFHLDGNDAESVECVRDILHQSSLLDVESHTVVDHLVAVGINALACSRAEAMALELAIESSQPPHRQPSTGPATQPACPATRAQVKALINDLLDDRSLQKGLEESIKGEQAFELDTAKFLANAGTGKLAMLGAPAMPGPLGVAIGPAFSNSGVRISQRMSERLAAVRTESSYSAVGKKLPCTELLWSNSTALTNATSVLERILEPSLGRFVETHFRILTQRRAAAIKLAIRLYQLDHAEKYPRSLDELVPNYLSAIPIDPYAAGPQAMNYVPSMEVDGVITPVIYSVAADGIDGKASTRPTQQRKRSEEPTVHERPWEREDLLFPLIAPPPSEPAPPDPVDAPASQPSP